MSYHDMEITTEDANTGTSFRAAVNSALQALASHNSSYSALTTTYAFEFWADTQNNLMMMRNSTNDAWLTIGSLTQSWALEFNPDYINEFISSKGEADGIASLDTNGFVVEQPASISNFLDTSATGSNGCTTMTITSDAFYDHCASGGIAGLTATIRLDEWMPPQDSTYNNASTSKHGLMPKADGTVTHFYNGLGGQTTPDHGSLGGLTDDDHPQYISHSDFAANQILACNTNGAAITVTVTEQTLIGRVTGGNIAALNSSQINTLLGVGEGTSMNLGPLPSTMSILGIKLTLTAGESIGAFNLCYLKSDGKMWKADASSYTTAPALYLSPVATVAAEGTGDFLKFGVAMNPAWSPFTRGGMLYLSTVAGGITETVPTGSGEIVQPIGYALTTNTIDFSPIFSFVKLV